ncbi:GABA-specific high-affinity permease [Hypocenomyce scalaris]|nr:GABA-specific high-affinity permease [Hypocenomyce scalaris]
MSPETIETPSTGGDVEKNPVHRTDKDVAVLGSDEELLASLGYKQELKRNFAMSEVFGISFSIIGLLASIASTLSFSIPGGPASMVWGWFLAGGCIFVVGLALADLSSAMPTSGGLYWWTHHLAPPKLKNPLSFLVGYSNTLGLVAGICSVDYGFALQFTSVIVMAKDGNWSPTRGELYAVFLGCVLLHGCLATVGARIMGKLQNVFVAINLILVVGTIIALPIGTGAAKLNDAKYIFVTTENLTTWPTGWAFMLAWLSPIWTISCFDSCVHMSEEAANATKAVPYGILMATSSTWILGFAVLIAIAACINHDLAAVVGTSLGQPMAQIYLDALGKSGAIGFMSLLILCQFLMGLSIVVACSRQSWAFSRDGALPFSSFFRVISVKFGFRLPFRAIWGVVGLAGALGLLCLIAAAASNALFSLLIIGNNVAYIIPVFCRAMWGDKNFVPGAFYTGRASKPIAWFAVVFLIFGVLLAMFPDGGPSPTPQNMNYAIIVSFPVWAGALAYYYIDAYKWFTGPKTTIDAQSTPTEVDGLHNAGYDTLAVELQSVSPPSTAPAKTVADDAAHIHGIVEALARDDKEVLVVMSSHGGIPGTQAVKNLTKKNDRSKAREEKE